MFPFLSHSIYAERFTFHITKEQKIEKIERKKELFHDI